MKRKLLIAVAVLSLPLAMLTQSFSSPGVEKKAEPNYGYQVFDLQNLTAAPAAQFSLEKSFAEYKILMKSLKARTTYNDTVTNAGTKTQYADFGFNPRALAIHVDLNRISGTAAGKLILEGSTNGLATGYKRIAITDSLNLTNVAYQWKEFRPTGNDLQYKFFQIKIIGTGTQSVRINSYGLVDKQP